MCKMSLGQMHKAGNLWLRRLPWSLRPATLFLQSYRAYPRGARSQKVTLQELSMDGDFTPPNHELSVTEQLEALEEMMDAEGGRPLHRNSHSDDFKVKEKVKAKIMERKYFRQPQEMNLLTWDAKEQVRYLSQEFPEEWTIDRLAESFPITKEGVIKLLKSDFYPRNIKELVKHDQRVKKNWLKLKDGKGGPAVLWYEKLLAEGKVEWLRHAAGNMALPRPGTPTDMLPASEQTGPVQLTNNKPRLFESIVKEYCDQKKAFPKGHLLEENNAHVRLVKENEESNRKLLSSIRILNSGKNSSFQQSVSKDKESFKSKALLHSERGRSYKYDDDNLAMISHDDEAGSSANVDMNIMMSHVSGESAMDVSSLIESAELVKAVETQHDTPNFVDSEDDGLKGTEKISKGQYLSTEHDIYPSNPTSYQDAEEVDEEVFLEQHIQQFQQNQIQKNMKSSVQFDTSVNTPDIEEAYIYEPDTGYQYPYGKYDNSVQDIDIPQEHKQTEHASNRTFRKGDSFYDEDGEFLFRIPY